MRFELTVTYDDGTVQKVVAGQREMAAFEAEPFGCSSAAAMDLRPMTFLRYIAWAALRRTTAGVPAYPKWSAGVDEVAAPDVDEVPAPDPTNPGPPGEG